MHRARLVDGACVLAAGLFAFQLRFHDHGHGPIAYLRLSLMLPLAYVICVALAGGYDPRFIGVGSDEFRKYSTPACSSPPRWRSLRTRPGPTSHVAT